ncbi:MAG: carboxylesterase family protein [Phenylobacterium sp.]|uniref:carboxylesterase/lipase family protein n=1 Tax=Phenylobacterium sp. TaxID=1871053 RepID=UPI0025FC6DCF|nr:carboxylesterase family protein [Phenylobacterium sp.]MBI1200581.1 carboxylesterase family protein [Phenylobacterium sp.]
MFDRRSILGGAAAAAGLIAAPRAARAVTADDIFPVVETAQGRLRGMRAAGVNMFKGVRYGAPTSGKQRFMPPAPPPKWAGVRDAYRYGQIAPQMPNGNSHDYGALIMFDLQPGGMGEDCLVANIWTPTLDPNAKKPVLVHLHGGGFYGGSGNSPGFDGEELARFGDCVVVTVNHRLGAFGYLNLAQSGPEFATSGASGMLDIVAALRWVRENAAAFGGDPGRVLVFGQSGGGAKTSVLMAMPSAKGLFHRAGIMSGSALRVATAEQAQAGTAAYLKILGLGAGDVRKLQALPFETLLAAQATMEAADRARGEAPRSFSPSLDATALPRHPFDPDAPAVSADVPLIVSTVLDERSYRMVNFDLDEAGLRAFIAKRVGADRAGDVLAMYRREEPNATPFVLQARFETDEVFRKPALILAARKSAQMQAGGAPVWMYYWRQPTPAFSGRYGTPHGSDVGPSLHDTRGGLNGSDPSTLALADQLASAWVSLAATGDPNNPRLPKWPAYAVPERATMTFGPRAELVNDPRSEARRFWEAEAPRASR